MIDSISINKFKKRNNLLIVILFHVSSTERLYIDKERGV